MTRRIQRRHGAKAWLLGAMMWRSVVAAGVVLAAFVAAGCSGETGSPPQGGRRSEPLDSTARPRFETPTVNSAIEYGGRLLSLNDSAVRGTVTIRVDGPVIRVTAAVRELDPSRKYRVVLHGFPDRRLPALPPFRETVTAKEVDESLGPALVELAALRVDGAGGSLRETSQRVERQVYPLDVRAIVISEVLPDGTLFPVAGCVLKPAELGDDGSGGPGTPGVDGIPDGTPGGGTPGGGTAPGGTTSGDGQGAGVAPGTSQGAGDNSGTNP